MKRFSFGWIVELPWFIISSSLKKRPLWASLYFFILHTPLLPHLSSLPTSNPPSRHQVRLRCHRFDIFVAVCLHTNPSSWQKWRGGKLEGDQMTEAEERRSSWKGEEMTAVDRRSEVVRKPTRGLPLCFFSYSIEFFLTVKEAAVSCELCCHESFFSQYIHSHAKLLTVQSIRATFGSWNSLSFKDGKSYFQNKVIML